jgi:hypothetical protein
MTLAQRFEIWALTWENVGTTKDDPAGWWNTAARSDPRLIEQRGAGVKPTHYPAFLVTPSRRHLAVEVVR